MFDAIIGNDNTKETLEKSLKLNKVSHSYLFVGISGIGKKEFAKEFAKSILCLNEQIYCNNCKSCIEFDSSNNPDFMLIEPESGKIKIEKIRELQKKVAEKPIISNNKVCIINDADLMTVEAQNCLLKTLEEPPLYMTIILICTNESSLLETIKSRCTIIHFNRINDKQIENYMEKNYGILPENSNIIDIADGSIGRAIKFKDETEIYEKIKNIIKDMSKKDITEILKEADIIYKSKEEIFDILEYINVLLIKIGRRDYKYAKCVEFIEETKKRIKANSNYNMCIDYMLFSIWGEINEKYSWSKI